MAEKIEENQRKLGEILDMLVRAFINDGTLEFKSSLGSIGKSLENIKEGRIWKHIVKKPPKPEPYKKYAKPTQH